VGWLSERVPSARVQGVIYALGGAALMGVAGAAVYFGGRKLDEHHVSQRAGGRLMVIPVMGLPIGMVLIYVGLTKILVGARADRIAFGRVTLPGLLYLLGFAGTILLAILAIIRWDLM
jgi:hypothetical protein